MPIIIEALAFDVRVATFLFTFVSFHSNTEKGLNLATLAIVLRTPVAKLRNHYYTRRHKFSIINSFR